MCSLSRLMVFAGVTSVSSSPDQPGDHVFENKDLQVGNPTLFFVIGFGLIAFAIIGFIFVLGIKHGQMTLHLTTTLPMIFAVGMLARGFSQRNQPSRVVVGPDGMKITTKRSSRVYSWSEIGSATKTNVLNTPHTCLRITDTFGKVIIKVDESFPDYLRLVKLVESYIDAKPDDTSIRIMSRKAKRAGVVCFLVGSFLSFAAVFIAYEARNSERSKKLLAEKGVVGDGEIVRRFVAPNGVTKRIEFRVAGSKIKNVEVTTNLWNELEHVKTLPVIYVPDEPDINRLEFGEVKDDDFMKTPRGGFLFSGLFGLMALFFLSLSPFAWMGYDLAFDDKQRIWKVKRYGRVVWASKKEAVE